MNKTLIRKWNGFFRGSIMLHRHQHNHEDYNVSNREAGLCRYDVGVDANHMSPATAMVILKNVFSVRIIKRVKTII